MQDIINRFLKKDSELSLTFDNGISKIWETPDQKMKLFCDRHGDYTLINNKRLVDITKEFYDDLLNHEEDFLHHIMLSTLTDLGLDMTPFKGVYIKEYKGNTIYIYNKRESYGDIIACEYVLNKDLIIERSPYLQYTGGIYYENRVRR